MNLFIKSYRKIIFGFILFTAVSFASIAQDLKSKIPTDPNIVTGKLENGLTYYIRQNHKPANKVELRIAVKAGSILENDDQQGLAHFMEHMNFNGTKNFEKNDLVSYLQSIGVQFGADLNAYTGFDETVYILPIPTDKKDNLEKGFQIIEDWAHNALLTEKDIDEERGVVLEESRLGKGADDRMMKKYFPQMMEGSLYGKRLPIGKDDIIKNSKYDKVRSFYHDWYRPDLQAVIIVGDIEIETAKKMLNDHFGKLKNPANERERKYVSITPSKAPRAMVVTDKEATNYILQLAFPYTKKHETITLNDYRNDIKKNLALGIINHRLRDLSQGSNPPFPFAGVGFDDMIHGYESFMVYSGFGSDGVDKALNAIVAELLKIKKFGISESELTLVKNEIMSNVEKAFNERNTTDSKDYVEEYLRNFLSKETIPGITNEYAYNKSLLPDINLTEVNAVVKEWLANQNTFTLITGPDKKEVKLPSDKELLALTAKAFKQDIKQNEEKVVSNVLMKSIPSGGSIVAQQKEDGLDATTYILSNGIKVTIKSTDFKSDEIVLTGIKKGGKNNYGIEDKYNAHFATDLVKAMGVGDFTPNDLEKAIAGRKISVSTNMENISNTVSASSTVKDFEAMLQLLNLNLTAARKDKELFESYKEKQKTIYKDMISNPQTAFFDTLLKTIYNNNPLTAIQIPHTTDFDKINLDKAIQIYNNEFSTADGYHFFIVGNIKAETALPLIAKYLGSLQKTNKVAAFKDNSLRPIKGNSTFKFYKGKEKQSMIVGLFAGDAPYSEDFRLKVLAAVEVLNIKVIEEIREKMGAIYGGGLGAQVEKDPYEYFRIQMYLPCGPENVDKVIVAANAEIEKIKTNGAEAKDLDKVKSQLHEKHVTDLIENKYWADRLLYVIFWGRDKDRLINFDNYLQKLTPADIKGAANTIFNGNNNFTAILYPEKE